MKKHEMMDKIIQYQMRKISTNEVSKALDEYTSQMKTTEQLILENVQLPLPSAYPDYDVEKMNRVLNNIALEVLRAKTLYPTKFISQHEGYAVILEELDELWDEIKKKHKNYDLNAQRKEATQAAAMLVRFIVELL